MPGGSPSPRTIFLDAVENYPPSAWRHFVEAACDGNVALRGQVERLLDAHQSVDGFMARPAISTTLTAGPTPVVSIGTLVGRYKLMEQIGEGGMGVVYVAEQTEPVRRQVALKIIKPGMDTIEVVARFEVERQALAMMEHPNIARVLDAGATEAGHPYFVMELVSGATITEHCDTARLGLHQRLKLFIDLCQAVEHAHRKGILHRDLKPSNVMITVQDGNANVKVIDFGIAKAVGPQSTKTTIFSVATHFVGTPLYMSPEQSEMRGTDIDARSDVYSLGVLLYELLTGHTPFDKETLAKVGIDEVRRIIREDEPLRPSRRFSTLGEQDASTISQGRGLEVRRISKMLSGELDWIVMKSLEKEPTRRYESAKALAEDVERFLSDRPILARAPSRWLRLRKWQRRHPAWTASVAMVFLLIGVAFGAILWHDYRLRKEMVISDTLREESLQLELSIRSQNIANDLSQAWIVANVGESPEVRRLLNRHPRMPSVADDRGFAWHYLDSYCPEPTHVFEGHGGKVLTADLSPDASLLASGDREGNVHIWDRVSGQRLRDLKYSDLEVCVVRFSPDGKLLAAAGQDQSIRIWDVKSWRELATLQRHNRTICDVSWSPDSRLLASGGRDAQVFIWNVDSQSIERTLLGHHDVVRKVDWSPNGRFLATADGSLGVNIWSATDWSLLGSLPTEGESGVMTIAFSRDGRFVAYAGYGNPIRMWDVERFELVAEAIAAEQVWSMVFTPQGELMTGSGDGVVQIWERWPQNTTLQCRRRGFGESGTVRSVCLSRDAGLLVTASEESRTLKTWNFSAVSGQTSYTLPTGSLGFEPHCDLAFSADGENHLFISDALDGHLRNTLPFFAYGQLNPVYCGQRNAIALPNVAEKHLTLWNASTWEPQQHFLLPQETVHQLSFSADGEWLAAGCSGGVAGVWNLKSGTWRTILHDPIRSWGLVACSPTRPICAVATAFGSKVSLWPLQGENPLWEIQTSVYFESPAGRNEAGMAFSPDGMTLATCDGKQISFWDATNGTPLASLRSEVQLVPPLSFSPDGQTLACGGTDNSVRLWDVRSRRELFAIHRHQATPTSIQFLSSMRLAVSSIYDRQVVILDASNGSLLKGAFDGNESQAKLSLSNSTVAENRSAGTIIGTFSTAGGIDEQSTVFTLVAGAGAIDNSLFSIAGNTLKTAACLDFETKPTCSVRVRSTDGYGGGVERVFTINVSNVFDPIPNSGTADDLVYQVPDNGVVYLEDDDIAGNGMSRLRSATGSFETTMIPNPAGSLTINCSGAAGMIAINNLPDFTSGLTIGSAAAPFKYIELRGVISLGTNKSLIGNASVNIALPNASGVATSGLGSIKLTSMRNIYLGQNSRLAAVDGNIELSANMNGSTRGDFHGITSEGGAIVTSGTGNISLLANGGTDENRGIEIGGDVTIPSVVQAKGTGSITINGAGRGDRNGFGVDIRVDGTSVVASAGNIIISGLGSPNGFGNRGLDIQDRTEIRAHGPGTISLVGVGGGDTGINEGIRIERNVRIVASGSGGISITGTAGKNSPWADLVLSSGVLIDASVATVGARISLTANSISLESSDTPAIIHAGAGKVTLNPRTAGTSIRMKGDLAINIDGVIVDTQYQQMNVVGAVDLRGTRLVVRGTYRPLENDRFLIVNNDGVDPIIGTFEGLPEGATIIVNGANLRISYLGGDGNDIELIGDAPPP